MNKTKTYEARRKELKNVSYYKGDKISGIVRSNDPSPEALERANKRLNQIVWKWIEEGII